MKLLVISDLHLGMGDRFDTFGWSDEDFQIVLLHMLSTHQVDQLVLNGDVFELYRYDYEALEKRHSHLIDLFKSLKAVFIKGNHDLSMPMGCMSHVITSKQGARIHIEHGHAADYLNGTGIGRAVGGMLHSLLQNLINSRRVQRIYFEAIHSLENVNRIPRKYNTYKYLQYALRLLRTADLVILSHTHKVEGHSTYYLHHRKQYYNTGSCSLGRFQGVLVDTDTLGCETIKQTREECQQIVGSYLNIYTLLSTPLLQ